MSLSFRIVSTPCGYVGLVAGPRGLRSVFLPEPSAARQLVAIRREYPQASENKRLLPELADDLRRYFSGEEVAFATRPDWADATDFMQAVWRACAAIPYGQTVSYGELARRVGRPGAARAIGTAMSRNPCPIIVPCHRVVRSDGGPGGYSGPGGVAFKRRLLALEGAARPRTKAHR